MRKHEYVIQYTVVYAKILAWQHLDDANYRAAIGGLINEVVGQPRTARKG